MARWGLHPVLEAAFATLDEDGVPRELEDAIPPRRTLTTRELLEIGKLCVHHIRPRAPKSSLAELDRLAALVDRQLASAPECPREPWHDELFNARRDFEHGRGAVKIAALAAQI